MTGQRLGMLSLRLDALYCLVLGSAVALLAPSVSSSVVLPPPLIVGTGVAVVLWAALVEWMRATLDLRLALRIVMAANIVATALVALVSFTAAAVLAVLAILAIAIDIGLFAGSQAFALGRLRTNSG